MQGVQSRWGRGSRPIVLALSNPSEVAECTAQQAYNWSGGKAVYASGTAFPPFQTEEGVNVPAQANNSLIFPGILFKRPFACSCKCRMETLHARKNAVALQSKICCLPYKAMESDVSGPRHLILSCSSVAMCGLPVWHRSWAGLHSRRCQADHT